MRFSWLAPTYHHIARAYAQGLGHHALLFTGDAGVGVAALVQNVMALLACAAPQNDEPCGHCRHCQLWQKGNYPDYSSLAPIDDKDISVEQVRLVTEKLTQHAQYGNKIILVQNAERLTEAAANALLKTLEEPRPNTYFLLHTRQKGQLLPTIASRCQHWAVNAPNTDVALQWLKNEWAAQNRPALPDDVFLNALRQNFHQPLTALAFLENNKKESCLLFLRQFWRFFQYCSPMELLPFFAKEDSTELDEQLNWLDAFFADALKSKLGIRTTWQGADLAKGVVQFANALPLDNLLAGQALLRSLRSDLRQAGINTELMLTACLTQLITDVFSTPNRNN